MKQEVMTLMIKVIFFLFQSKIISEKKGFTQYEHIKKLQLQRWRARHQTCNKAVGNSFHISCH